MSDMNRVSFATLWHYTDRLNRITETKSREEEINGYAITPNLLETHYIEDLLRNSYSKSKAIRLARNGAWIGGLTLLPFGPVTLLLGVIIGSFCGLIVGLFFDVANSRIRKNQARAQQRRIQQLMRWANFQFSMCSEQIGVLLRVAIEYQVLVAMGEFSQASHRQLALLYKFLKRYDVQQVLTYYFNVFLSNPHKMQPEDWMLFEILFTVFVNCSIQINQPVPEPLKQTYRFIAESPWLSEKLAQYSSLNHYNKMTKRFNVFHSLCLACFSLSVVKKSPQGIQFFSCHNTVSLHVVCPLQKKMLEALNCMVYMEKGESEHVSEQWKSCSKAHVSFSPVEKISESSNTSFSENGDVEPPSGARENALAGPVTRVELTGDSSFANGVDASGDVSPVKPTDYHMRKTGSGIGMKHPMTLASTGEVSLLHKCERPWSRIWNNPSAHFSRPSLSIGEAREVSKVVFHERDSVSNWRPPTRGGSGSKADIDEEKDRTSEKAGEGDKRMASQFYGDEEKTRVLKLGKPKQLFRSLSDLQRFDPSLKSETPIGAYEFSFLMSLEETNEKDDDWECTVQTARCVVHKKKGDSPVVLVKAFVNLGNIPISLASFFIQHIPTRKKWDKAFDDYHLVEKNIEDNELIYCSMRAPWPIAHRDFLQWRRMETTDDGTVMIMMRSALHEGFPEKPGVVRADTIISGYILRRSGDDTTLFIVAQTDIRGLVPKVIVNRVAQKAPVQWSKTFETACRQYMEIHGTALPDYETTEPAGL